MHKVPELSFPSIKYSKRATPINLTILLYWGGAKSLLSKFELKASTGLLGQPLQNRLELIKSIHEVMNRKLISGGSPESTKSTFEYFRRFFAWAEEAHHALTKDTIQSTYLHWADSLAHRKNIKGDLSHIGSYQRGAQVGLVLDEILDRATPLIHLTRLKPPPRRKSAIGAIAEKQNLAQTFAFGSLLQDVCDRLTIDTTLNGRLPVKIHLRQGGEITHWSGYKNPAAALRWKGIGCDEGKKTHTPDVKSNRFDAWETEGTLKTRYPLANLRCEAEMLMLVGQTGINLAQAHRLKIRNFCFISHLDGYHVKDRKSRKGGDVLFEIFKDYKSHFERYLEWRRNIFPDSELLFPFVRNFGRSEDAAPGFHRLRQECRKLGMNFVSPQALRNTRINWLLRISSDPEITSTMAQHSKETLLRIYERPSQHRAIGEVMQFWSKHDPAVQQDFSVAPGHCLGQPTPVQNIPKNVAKPNCVLPSGCLWCEHHRDVDSEDHVWSLACFRHLKIIELSKWSNPKDTREINPAQLTIDRISEKLRWFRDSSTQRNSWVEEALTLIDEGKYHPYWRRPIEHMEGAV
ncbi:site-specific integrase [Paucibacter sp. B51]|uniref:site-specific integrase n=1 Tax=Paucibacter sp. B51 TaxID=2993315 RepID=UPI0022EBCF30|nr:site-specific integrase [Paucibacter sp. B51]